MVYHVVSTKLTELEHKQLLKICEKIDCTPFQFIKESIKRSVNEIQEAGILDESEKKSDNVEVQKKKTSNKRSKIADKTKKKSKSEIVKEIIGNEQSEEKSTTQDQSETNEEELMYKQYNGISDVQELIKIYAELREKADLSEDDIFRLNIIHKVITQRMSK